MDNQSNIYQKEGIRVPRGYTGCIKRGAGSQTKGKKAQEQKTNQPTKTKLGNTQNISNKRALHIVNQAQDEKENKKQDFNLVLENASSSNKTLFLFFQITQIKQRGTALHNLKSFFRKGRRSQPSIKSFTKKGQTQPPPDKEKMAVHMHHTFGQCMSRCSKDCSSFPHNGHLLAREKPPFLS